MIVKKNVYTAKAVFSSFNAVEVTKATEVYEDGVLISRSKPHGYVIQAGDDYSEQPAEVQAVCAAVHTPEVIAARVAAQ